jgi:hypothetical protein
VLQNDHARAGLQRRDMRAVADARGSTATLAQGARRRSGWNDRWAR